MLCCGCAAPGRERSTSRCSRPPPSASARGSKPSTSAARACSTRVMMKHCTTTGTCTPTCWSSAPVRPVWPPPGRPPPDGARTLLVDDQAARRGLPARRPDGHHRRRRRPFLGGADPAAAGRRRGVHLPAAHHRDRQLRRELRGRGAAPHRPSARRRLSRGLPAAGPPHPRRSRGAGHRHPRASAGVRGQRPPGDHARGWGAHLPQPLCDRLRQPHRHRDHQRQRLHPRRGSRAGRGSRSPP